MRNCEIAFARNDGCRVHADGRNGNNFKVRASFGINHGWKVKLCILQTDPAIKAVPGLLPMEATVMGGCEVNEECQVNSDDDDNKDGDADPAATVDEDDDDKNN